MPKIAIMRHVKHKAGGGLRSSLQHNFRERETLNADEERTPDNEHLISSSTNEVIERMNQRLPGKVRKNGVVMVEYVMSASPEWFEENDESKHKEYFDKSMEYIKEKYGEKNIVGATIHKDESTPHLAVFVVPITKDGRLCANDYLNGRKLLSQEQTNYHKKVEHLGVDRGVEGSKARHTTIKQYYQEVNQLNQDVNLPKISPEELQPQVTKKGLIKSEKETPAEIANRLNRKIEPVFDDVAKKANSRRFEREQAKSQRETLLNTSKHLKEAKTMLKNYHGMFKKDLKPEQYQNLKEQAQGTRQENYMAELKAYGQADKSAQKKYRMSLTGDTKKEFMQRLEKIEKVGKKSQGYDIEH
jgi:hypothetical protein